MARTPWWIDTHIATQLTAGGISGPDLMGEFQADRLARRGLTVTRLLVHLAFLTTTEGGSEGIMRVDCGIGVITDDAFTAAARPDPDQDLDRPARGWLWRDSFVSRETVQGTNLVSPGFFIDHHVDIRARRRLDDGVLFLGMTNTIIAGTGHAVQVAGLIRTLVLLP